MLASLPLCLVGWCWSVGWGISLLNIASNKQIHERLITRGIDVQNPSSGFSRKLKSPSSTLQVTHQILESSLKTFQVVSAENPTNIQLQTSSLPMRQRSERDCRWSNSWHWKRNPCRELEESLRSLMWCLWSRGAHSSLREMDLILWIVKVWVFHRVSINLQRLCLLCILPQSKQSPVSKISQWNHYYETLIET